MTHVFVKSWDYRKKWERDSASKVHKDKGFTQSEKIYMNLCWLRSSLNLVKSFKPIELWMLTVDWDYVFWLLSIGLAVGWPSFSKEFLEDVKDSKDSDGKDCYIMFVLFHYDWWEERMFKTVCFILEYCSMINCPSVILMSDLWYFIKQIFYQPRCFNLEKETDFSSHRLNLRDSKLILLHIFILDVPLMAPVMTITALYWIVSIFRHKLSLFGWS